MEVLEIEKNKNKSEKHGKKYGKHRKIHGKQPLIRPKRCAKEATEVLWPMIRSSTARGC